MPHFPKSYDVGPNCELILWMTKFKAHGEGNNDVGQLTLRAIYTLPLIGRGMQKGVLEIIEDRLGEARQAKNSQNNNYVTIAKLQTAKDAIAEFKRVATAADKALSMTNLFVQQIWHDPAHPQNTPLGRLLQGLYEADVYFPPNHPGTDLAAIKNLIDPATATTLLWNYPFPDPDTLESKTLGDMTFEKIFQSELVYLYTYFKDTFKAIQAGKEHGVLRSHPDKPPKGEPDINLSPEERKNLGLPSVKVANNGKCCVGGTCRPVANHYCHTTTGNEGDPCNSMSDTCVAARESAS